MRWTDILIPVGLVLLLLITGCGHDAGLLNPEQAIAVFTLGGAYASFEETIKGSIEEGKLADLVVLSADPTRTPPSQLRNIRVEMTVIGGEIVFQRDD